VAPVPEFGALSLLPAGARPPNPQELLSRPALAVLLRELRGEFNVFCSIRRRPNFMRMHRPWLFRPAAPWCWPAKDVTHLEDTRSVIRELSDMGTCVVGTVFNALLTMTPTADSQRRWGSIFLGDCAPEKGRARRSASRFSTLAGIALLSMVWGVVVAVAGLNALYLCISLIGCVFILLDFRIGVVLLILLMPNSHSHIFPHAILGVTGLNR